MRELLLGCGVHPTKRIHLTGDPAWHDLTTVDINPDIKPDIVYDLNLRELAHFAGFDTFDEIHCYDVLEHLGRQGDWQFFLAQFEDFWRILKPSALFFGICPKPSSPWAWADPGHTRVIAPESLVYLDQTAYGRPPMTDYRRWYRGDFEIVHMGDVNEHQHAFVLRAIKPARGAA